MAGIYLELNNISLIYRSLIIPLIAQDIGSSSHPVLAPILEDLSISQLGLLQSRRVGIAALVSVDIKLINFVIH